MKNRIKNQTTWGKKMKHRVLSRLTVDLHFIVLYHFPCLVSGYARVSPSTILLGV